MSASGQEGTFRRKHKVPGTDMGEELHCETLAQSFSLWVPQFPYLYNNRSFGLFYAVMELKE